MIERKCPNCGQWNVDSDFCENCGTALSHKEIRKEEEKRRIEEETSKPKDRIDIWIDKGKNHKSIIVRGLFYLVWSIWFIVMGIGSFIAYLVAWTAG